MRIMFHQVSLKSLCIGLSVCFFLILATYRCFNDYRRNFEATRNYLKSKSNYDDVLLDLSRESLRIETWNYNFSQSGVEKLEDLVMEAGGTPIRSIVVSTWRSGSSFLGDLISSVPGSFYSYEPLKSLGNIQIRKLPEAIRATKLIKNLLKCDFNETESKKYLEFLKTHVEEIHLLQYNRRFWKICDNKQELCLNYNFIGRYCKLCPFHTMKLDRLRLPVAKSLLDATELNVKVVLLIRDPRGVMMSRWNIKGFCLNKQRESDCANAGVVCADMVADYKAAMEFLHKYPDKFKILRYEDLAFNLEESTAELLSFFGLEVADSVHQFLKTHTSVSNSEHFSTFRITKDIPFKWRKTLEFNIIKQIQEDCSEAMSLWGYEQARNASHIISPNFNPLIPFHIVNSRIAADSEKITIK